MVPVYTDEHFKNYWLQRRIDLDELLGARGRPVIGGYE